jgi:hypothetical protein
MENWAEKSREDVLTQSSQREEHRGHREESAKKKARRGDAPGLFLFTWLYFLFEGKGEIED